MKLRDSLGRIRLVDGVAVAALGLLLLKGIAWMSPGPAPARAESQAAEADRLPPFARALAHARTNYVPADPATTGSVPDAAKSGDGAAGATVKPLPALARTDPALASSSSSERAILERLGERREELQRRAREMETRERLIEDAERRLDSKLGDLKSLEEKREGAAPPVDAEAVALRSLVTMYETMKPKEAARVFDRLPHDVLVPVVRGMNARKMAEVLAAMTPENAEKLTVALARRSKGAAGDERQPATGLPAGELQAIEPPARAAQPR